MTRSSLCKQPQSPPLAGKETHHECHHAVSGDHLRPIGAYLHRVEPGGHGSPSEDARGCRGVAEQEIPGADLRLGLGAGAGGRLSDHPGPSFGGALCHRGAPRQPGALRAVPSTDGGKSPRRHGLRRSPHTAGGGRDGSVDALDGPAVDQGRDDQHLVARETAPPDHPPTAGHRSGDPAFRRHGGNQDLPGGQGVGPTLHITDDRVVPPDLRPGDAQHGGRTLPCSP